MTVTKTSESGQAQAEGRGIMLATAREGNPLPRYSVWVSARMARSSSKSGDGSFRNSSAASALRKGEVWQPIKQNLRTYLDAQIQAAAEPKFAPTSGSLEQVRKHLLGQGTEEWSRAILTVPHARADPETRQPGLPRGSGPGGGASEYPVGQRLPRPADQGVSDPATSGVERRSRAVPWRRENRVHREDAEGVASPGPESWPRHDFTRTPLPVPMVRPSPTTAP